MLVAECDEPLRRRAKLRACTARPSIFGRTARSSPKSRKEVSWRLLPSPPRFGRRPVKGVTSTGLLGINLRNSGAECLSKASPPGDQGCRKAGRLLARQREPRFAASLPLTPCSEPHDGASDYRVRLDPISFKSVLAVDRNPCTVTVPCSYPIRRSAASNATFDSGRSALLTLGNT